MARSSRQKPFKDAIVKCWKPGKSKHKDKKGTHDGKSGYLPDVPWVYSINHKDVLISFSKQLSGFISEFYPNVKYVGKIRVMH